MVICSHFQSFAVICDCCAHCSEDLVTVQGEGGGLSLTTRTPGVKPLTHRHIRDIREQDKGASQDEFSTEFYGSLHTCHLHKLALRHFHVFFNQIS